MIRQSVVVALVLGAFVCSAEAQRGKRRGPSTELSVQGLSPERGAPGTTVTLRGTFPGNAVVVMGGETVTPTSVKPRRLQFTVPDVRPGSHAVTVRAPRRGRVDAGTFRVERPSKGRRAKAAPGPGHRRRAKARRGPPRSTPTVSGFAPRSGPAGTEVKIRGRNLDADGLEVRFGGRAVEPTRTTSRAITFEVPRRAKDGGIVLRRARGSNLVVGQFEVTKDKRKRRSRAKRYEQQRKEAQAEWRARRQQLAEDREARLEELRRQEEELRRSREERRRKRAAALAAKFERRFRAQPDVQAELALNAERSARLDRMLRLAEAHDDGRLVVRVRVLQRQEADRHEQRMDDLRLAFRSR